LRQGPSRIYALFMTADQTAPATKQDIQLLMEQIGGVYEQFGGLYARFDEERLYTSALIENLRKDVFDVQDHKFSVVNNRLMRIEKHLNIAA
jgi:hypothetical protein